jgi:hypothetical protein
VKDKFLISKMLWKMWAITRPGKAKAEWLLHFYLFVIKSHLQRQSCSSFLFKNISPQMFSLLHQEIPGRPYASSLCCWSVNKEIQQLTCANWPGPSPLAQTINGKEDRQRGSWHLFGPLKPIHSYSNFCRRTIKCPIKCTWPWPKKVLSSNKTT